MLRNSRTSEVLRDFAVVVLWDVMVFKLDQFLKKSFGGPRKMFHFGLQTNVRKCVLLFPLVLETRYSIRQNTLHRAKLQ